MPTNMIRKYTASVERRPIDSAIGGSTMQPRMVPTERIIVPYDARRAAAVPRADERVGKGRQKKPEVVARVHVAGALGTPIFGPLLCDEGSAHGPLAADADAGEETEERQLPDARGHGAEKREDGVAEDGE